jgi:hypothetical protein
VTPKAPTDREGVHGVLGFLSRIDPGERAVEHVRDPHPSVIGDDAGGTHAHGERRH